jgi:hypothetical protein
MPNVTILLIIRLSIDMLSVVMMNVTKLIVMMNVILLSFS